MFIMSSGNFFANDIHARGGILTFIFDALPREVQGSEEIICTAISKLFPLERNT